MFFTSKLAPFALVACFSLAVIPLVRSVEIDVTVGGTGILQYTPNSVNANVGDVIRFTFKQKNHTATQSTLASPCTPKEGGFDSGFVPVADSVTEGFPAAILNVTDTDPIWVYCRQVGHCEQGMVFAVNPGDNLAAFQAAATGSSSAASSATAAAASVVTVTATVTDSAGGDITTTYASFPGSASPTSAVSSDHRIIVGGTAGLVYSPSNITAQVGDTVTFEFHEKNHTATQSSFADPCRALTLTSTTGQIGFDSEFMPVAANATTFPTFTIQINDTTPIWAYCRQAGHCGQGMVFAVNAVETSANTFEAFKAKAIALNGTSTSASGSASASPSASATSKNSATNLRLCSTSTVLAFLGLIAGTMW